MTDTLALPLAEELLDCLCDALADTIAGPTCGCCVLPGPAVMDCCPCGAGEGMAWVRVVSITPTSTRFPDPQTTSPKCGRGLYAVVLEVGAYRCVSVPDEDGTPPSCDDLAADAAKILDDARAMRQAIACCFTKADPHRQVRVGGWSAIGPEGGCAGGSITVTVEGTDCCPPATP